MATTEFGVLVRHVCQTLGICGTDNTPDAQLLERFLKSRDEAAFKVLVWRHGRMVLGVCRRVLRNAHDADDAFQATFLALARRADTLEQRESLAGWLYRVAYRIALRARAAAAKRAEREQLGLEPVALTTLRGPADEAAQRDLQGVLHEELSRLPARYRAPLVLCYLEGLTNQEAAEQLGCPKGTVATRLARARERLRNRLRRRGMGLSAVSLLALLCTRSASEAAISLPAGLVGSTTKAAMLSAADKAAAALAVPSQGTALAAEALKAPPALKTNVVWASLLLLGVLAGGAGAVRLAGGLAETDAVPSGCRATPESKLKRDLAQLQRTWTVLEVHAAGAHPLAALRRGQRVVITKDKLTFAQGNGVHEVAFQLDAASAPKAIDLTLQDGARAGETVPGVYRLAPGCLTLCCDLARGAPRPTDFSPRPASGMVLVLQLDGGD